jgi:hypothetical protein
MLGLDLGLVISIATTSAAVLAWYRSVARNQYAKERQYDHIIKNLEQAASAHQEIYKELDSVTDRLSRLEILLLRNSHASQI